MRFSTHRFLSCPKYLFHTNVFKKGFPNSFTSCNLLHQHTYRESEFLNSGNGSHAEEANRFCWPENWSELVGKLYQIYNNKRAANIDNGSLCCYLKYMKSRSWTWLLTHSLVTIDQILLPGGLHIAINTVCSLNLCGASLFQILSWSKEKWWNCELVTSFKPHSHNHFQLFAFHPVGQWWKSAKRMVHFSVGHWQGLNA